MMIASLNNIAVRTKLLLFLLLPLATVVMFASLNIHDRYLSVMSARHSLEFAETSIELVELIRQLQNERSISVRYSESGGRNEREALRQQRTITNARIDSFSLALEQHDPGSEYWGKRDAFRPLVIGLQKLITLREVVDSDHVNPSPFYVELNRSALKIVSYLQIETADTGMARQADAYSTLLILEERSWQERDVLNNIAASGHLSAADLQSASALQSDQETLLENVYALSTPVMLAFLNSKITASDKKQFEDLRKVIIRRAINQSTRTDLINVIRNLVVYRGLVIQSPIRSDGSILVDTTRLEHITVEGLSALEQLRDMTGMTDTESGRINILVQGFREYREAIDSLAQGFAELDQTALVLASYDQRAGQVLQELEHQVPINAADWWDRSGHRIQLIKSVSDVAGLQLLADFRAISKDAGVELTAFSLLAALCVLFSCWLGYLLVHRLVHALSHIAAKMREMRETDNLDISLELDGDDEIGELASAFDRLIESRRQSEIRRALLQDELLRVQRAQTLELEDRVARRTDELNQALRQAELAVEAKSRFLGNVSHHVRTPLNGILGNTQILLQDPTLSSEKRRQLDSVAEQGNQLLTLMNNILEIVSLEAGRSTSDNSVVDIGHFLRTLEGEFAELAQRDRLQLRVVLDHSTPDKLSLDEQKLHKVMDSLVGNAIRFTVTGSVEIRVGPESPGDGSGSPNQDQLKFEINDTGPGISADKIGAILGTFEQIETGCESHAGGVGLGLSISRALVQLMGGELQLQSQVGVGTQVSFSLPMDVVSAREKDADHECATASDGKSKESAVFLTPEGVNIARERWMKIETCQWNIMLAALNRADFLAVNEAVIEVKSVDIELGTLVQKFADNFDYDSLRELVEARTGSRDR